LAPGLSPKKVATDRGALEVPVTLDKKASLDDPYATHRSAAPDDRRRATP